VDEAGAVAGADEAIVEDAEGAGGAGEDGEDRLVGQSEEVGALERGEAFVLLGLLVGGGEAGLGEEVDVLVGKVADGDIIDIRSGADGEVAVEGPGGGGPDQGEDGRAAGIEARRGASRA
jgi:hypothetical protein